MPKYYKKFADFQFLIRYIVKLVENQLSSLLPLEKLQHRFGKKFNYLRRKMLLHKYFGENNSVGEHGNFDVF